MPDEKIRKVQGQIVFEEELPWVSLVYGFYSYALGSWWQPMQAQWFVHCSWVKSTLISTLMGDHQERSCAVNFCLCSWHCSDTDMKWIGLIYYFYTTQYPPYIPYKLRCYRQIVQHVCILCSMEVWIMNRSFIRFYLMILCDLMVDSVRRAHSTWSWFPDFIVSCHN